MVILEPGQGGKLAVTMTAAVLVRASVGLERVTARALSVEDSRAKESVLRWQTAPGIHTSHRCIHSAKTKAQIGHYTLHL